MKSTASISQNRRPNRIAPSQFAAACVLASLAATAGAQQEKSPTPEEVIQRIDAAVHTRINSIAQYAAKEHYAIFRNGDQNSSSDVTVQAAEKPSGKTFTTISKSGSAFMRSAVIDKVLSNETEMSKPANLESVLLTSANYDMHPELGKVSLNGRECFIVDMTSKRKDPHLLNGKIWVDAGNGSIVHLEGKPSASASIFSGDIIISRDYAVIDGFAMATHAEAHSHSFLFGDTVLKIDYSDYQIQRATPDKPTTAASKPPSLP
jgi:hypothetical protein